MAVTCSFCSRKGYRIDKCKRIKAIVERISTEVLLRVDTFNHTRELVEKLRAEVEFLRRENEIMAEENRQFWAGIEGSLK